MLFRSHTALRGCYGPDSVEECGADALDQGGLGSISEQMIGTRADLSLGGGAESFAQIARAGQWQGDALFDQATERGYQVVRDAAGLEAVSVADQEQPVLGAFTDGNFPTRYAPTVATVGGADEAPQVCQPNPDRLTTDLSLRALTERSIDLLDNDEGFFLQVEGASIDKRDHAADACGQIGEVLDLDEAVQAALEFAESDGETLVIVTADHAHTSQIVDKAPPATLSTALTTEEGSVMKIAYGTAAAGESQQHTGTQLRVAGYGPGAANVVGLIDQTDNFFTIVNALELDRDLDSLSGDATISAPDEVQPGAEFTVTADCFFGDRQVTVALNGESAGTVDVVDGTASYTFTAPADADSVTVSFTGVQSGVVVTDDVGVTADAASDEDKSDDGAAILSGAGSNSGPLALTGTAVASGLLLALMLTAVGAVLVARRTRGAREGSAPLASTPEVSAPQI